MVRHTLFLLMVLTLFFTFQAFSQSEVGDSNGGILRIFRVGAPKTQVPQTNAPSGMSVVDRLPVTPGQHPVKERGNSYPLKAIDFCKSYRTAIGISFGLSSQTPCGAKEYLHPATVDFIDKYLHECTREGLRQVGVTQNPLRVVIDTMSLFSDRNVRGSGKPSQHSIGNAIDIHQIQVEYADGSKAAYPAAAVGRNGRTMPGFERCTSGCRGQRFKKSGNALFYVGFKACLDKKMESIIAGRKCAGGTLGCDDNADHNNHIHLSAPICPPPQGISTI